MQRAWIRTLQPSRLSLPWLEQARVLGGIPVGGRAWRDGVTVPEKRKTRVGADQSLAGIAPGMAAQRGEELHYGSRPAGWSGQAVGISGPPLQVGTAGPCPPAGGKEKPHSHSRAHWSWETEAQKRQQTAGAFHGRHIFTSPVS